MSIDTYHGMMLSRFSAAEHLQRSAHYYSMKQTQVEKEKGLFSMIADILQAESKKMTDLGIQELKLSEGK